jgi:hypothetical protein
MPICPRGHESQAEDWCDFCGFPMTPPPGLAVPGAPGHLHHQPPAPMAPPPAAQGFPDITEGLVICPICRTPQTGRYCEECGYDYDLSSPSQRRPPAQAPANLAHPVPPAPPANPGIPAAYGGPQAPQPPQPPQTPQPPQAPGGYGYPQANPYEQPYEQPAYEQPAYEQPGPYGYEQQQPQPQQYEQPAPYGYEKQQHPFEPEPALREGTGPVYAQPGPAPQGQEFGTSFRLAPPAAPGADQSGEQGGAAQQPVRSTWFAVVSADRDYFTDMMARSGPEAAGLFFPPYCPERRIPLTGRGQLRIGRRSQHRGTVPEIDLSVPPEDPGASHQHALLAEQADGSWVLVDQDSTNGTTVNGGAESITPHTAIPLNDGDRVHVGAWTTITLHRA